MQQTITISTPAPPVADLYDLTRQGEAIVSESGVQTGLGMFMYRVPLPES